MLPAALLAAALGLLLGFAPRRATPVAIVATAVAGLLASFAAIGASRIEVAYAGCWASVILIAGLVHLRRVPVWLAIVAALDCGAWSGLLVSGGGNRLDLLRALPATLIALPGGWAVRRGWGVAPKVASSWLIAIALLAALLPAATATPGYVPDHMD